MPPFISTNIIGTQPLPDCVGRWLALKSKVDTTADAPNSPLHHLLNSNVAPSDSEIVTIRALVIDAEARIEGFYRSPTDDRSQATESQLLGFIHAHKALLSPVRRIPSEILHEIFLYYAECNAGASSDLLAKIPWRLGQISYRWREIALSLPPLWDNIPRIDITEASLAKPSSVRAFTRLLQRSGASPTLKFDIYRPHSGEITAYPIIKEVVRHSERIESLSIVYFDVTDATLQALQGLKGHLQNLRILRLWYTSGHWTERPTLDVFEDAPALRQVTLLGDYRPGRHNIRLVLPWSQITHFEDEVYTQRGAELDYVPLASLRSLTYLHIDKRKISGLAPSAPFEPMTLPDLHTLKVQLSFCGELDENRDIFLDYLTLPAIEVIKISYPRPESLIPHFISMFCRSDKPSRLQKLAFRTASLEPGELSMLLKFTPELIELDIRVPPIDDILSFIHREGEHMLVPKLQALYMTGRSPLERTQAENINIVARVRCEMGGKDSGGVFMQNTLDMLHIDCVSSETQRRSQRVLNCWSPAFNTHEADVLSRLSGRVFGHFHRGLFYPNQFDPLDGLFSWIEQCEAITDKVLRETNAHLELRCIISGFWFKVPDENEYQFNWQRAMDVLDKWERLLLNSLDEHRWAKGSPESANYSLVYVPKHKYNALRMSPYALSIVYGLRLEDPFKKPLWDRV